jgi:general secretion pathway protein C
MRRWAIWAANAALFTLGCFLLARIGVAILAEVALPARAEVIAIRPGTSAVAQSWADHNIITDRNIFGAKLTAEEVVVEVEPDLSLEAALTKLPLELLGTVASNDPSIASAAINDVGTRKHQVVYLGDALDNHPLVTVHSITRAVVFLESNGKLEKLELADDGTDRAAKRKGRPKAKRAARRRAPRKSAAVKAPLEQLKQNAGGRSTATLYSQARIVPKWEDGKMVGVQLNQVKKGSLYEKIGIRSGDVITSLNGISIDSPQASSKLLSEFTQAKEFDIIMHDKRQIKVSASELK